MKILIACEESQVVCAAFREKGHEAFSCDILPCSGNHPKWHYEGDIRNILVPSNRLHYFIESYPTGLPRWDLVIAFPPCTDLCVSGAKHFAKKKEDGRQQKAIDFFMMFAAWNQCPIAIENPIGIMNTLYRKPDQIIQPWQFGHGETKSTCLWLKGLPLLRPTNIVSGRAGKVWRMPPSPDRAKLRSKTYPGIAQAMAEQWG